MTWLQHLPAEVGRLIQTRFIAEFATVSAAGVPIDTPIVIFTSEDLTTLDLGTGLAYPAKAERARRNPKVGLLLEGADNEPVVSIAGMAAVRDNDIQANLERYVAEEVLAPYMNPKLVDYDSVTRHAVWYFARILVCVMPVHIRWWTHRAAMDQAPHQWRAPADTIYPKSDPAPPGTPGETPKWPLRTWQETAQVALARGARAHLSLIDAEGFPIPIPVRDVKFHEGGFVYTVPKAAPWSTGKATLTFEGVETFIGDAHAANGSGLLHVERALPILPMMLDATEVLRPKPETKANLMKRLEHELQRRGQTLPKMPARPPKPTPGARLRAAVADAYPGIQQEGSLAKS
jgi:hypothetical protein